MSLCMSTNQWSLGLQTTTLEGSEEQSGRSQSRMLRVGALGALDSFSAMICCGL